MDDNSVLVDFNSENADSVWVGFNSEDADADYEGSNSSDNDIEVLEDLYVEEVDVSIISDLVDSDSEDDEVKEVDVGTNSD